MAGSRAPVDDPVGQLHGFVRVAEGTDPHQSSLRGILPWRAVLEGGQPPGKRLLGADAERRAPVRDAGGGRSGVDGERDRRRDQGRRRLLRRGRERCPQAHLDRPRAGLRAGKRALELGQAQMPGRHLVRGGPVFPLQIQTLRRRAARVHSGNRHRSIRRRPRQFSISALVARLRRSARLRARQARARRRTTSRSTSPGRARANWSSYPDIPAAPPGSRPMPSSSSNAMYPCPPRSCAPPSCAAATFNTAVPISRTWNWSRAP